MKIWDSVYTYIVNPFTFADWKWTSSDFKRRGYPKTGPSLYKVTKQNLVWLDYSSTGPLQTGVSLVQLNLLLFKNKNETAGIHPPNILDNLRKQSLMKKLSRSLQRIRPIWMLPFHHKFRWRPKLAPLVWNHPDAWANQSSQSSCFRMLNYGTFLSIRFDFFNVKAQILSSN